MLTQVMVTVIEMIAVFSYEHCGDMDSASCSKSSNIPKSIID